MYEDVGDAAKELPAVMEWLNELRQSYIEDRERAKARLDEAEAAAYFALRSPGPDGFTANYVGKMTEDAMKMAVVLDPDVKKAKDALAAMTAMVSRLSGTIDALHAKVELIRSSEATRRSAFEESTPRASR